MVYFPSKNKRRTLFLSSESCFDHKQTIPPYNVREFTQGEYRSSNMVARSRSFGKLSNYEGNCPATAE